LTAVTGRDKGKSDEKDAPPIQPLTPFPLPGHPLSKTPELQPLPLATHHHQIRRTAPALSELNLSVTSPPKAHSQQKSVNVASPRDSAYIAEKKGTRLLSAAKLGRPVKHKDVWQPALSRKKMSLPQFLYLILMCCWETSRQFYIFVA